VAATPDSASGHKHPTFSFDLAGNGDMVLTQVAERHEGLKFPASAPAGTYYVVDERGVVVAEAVKAEGERLIALAPGAYTVKRRLLKALRIGELRVLGGQITEIDEGTFRTAPFSDDPVKGTGLSATYVPHWSVSVTGNYQAVFDRPTAQGGYFPSAPLVGLDATFHNFLGRGFSVSVDALYGWTSGTVTTPTWDLPYQYKYSMLSLGAAVLYEWGQEGRWIPFGGIHLSINLMNRAFTDATVAAQTYSVLTPGAFAGLKVRLTRSFSAVARVRVHYLLYNVDETRSLGTADFGALIDYEFRE
jgi:hypothetical protein